MSAKDDTKPSIPPITPMRSLIPPEYADIPTQRLYVLALFIFLQAYKFADLISPPAALGGGSLKTAGSYLLIKWIVLDLTAVFGIHSLRISRLRLGNGIGRILLIPFVVGINWMLFGSWSIMNVLHALLPALVGGNGVQYRSVEEKLVSVDQVKKQLEGRNNLGGQFTIHMLATQHAQFNPHESVYCVPFNSNQNITVPILLNNTQPTSFDFLYKSPAGTEYIRSFSVSQLVQSHPNAGVEEDTDLEKWVFGTGSRSDKSRKSGSGSTFLPTQSLYQLSISQPGYYSLSRVHTKDSSQVSIRRTMNQRENGDVNVVICPRGGFEGEERRVNRCLVNPPEIRDVGLTVSGEWPLEAKWRWTTGNGQVRRGGLKNIAPPNPTNQETVAVPVEVSLDRAGVYKFQLESITDKYGHTAHFNDPNLNLEPGKSNILPLTRNFAEIEVHVPDEAFFAGECARGNGIRLLEGQKSRVQVQTLGENTDVTAVFMSEEEEKGGKTIGGKGEEMKFGGNARASYDGYTRGLYIDKPGTLELIRVKDEHCEGLVRGPSTCKVFLQPKPTLDVTFTPFHDLCSSEVGSVAHVHLTGEPPFEFQYTMAGVGGKSSPVTIHTDNRRYELHILPNDAQYQEWIYTFHTVSDKYYRKINLVGEEGQYEKKQYIAPYVGANWRRDRQGLLEKVIVPSCDGDSVTTTVELSGEPPFELEYSVAGAKPQVVSNITSMRHQLEISIPPKFARNGGQVTVTLDAITDKLGCKRPLSETDLVIDVRRTKPTVRFQSTEYQGLHESTVLENEAVKLPLVFTGTGPWSFSYIRPNDEKVHWIENVRNFNYDLAIKHPEAGQYKVRSVHDSLCPGIVQRDTWNISLYPRPQLMLDENAGVFSRKENAIIRHGVCQNQADALPVHFKGRVPFEAHYRHRDVKGMESLQFSTLQNQTSLLLITDTPGRHEYTFTSMYDGLYKPSNLPVSGAGILYDLSGNKVNTLSLIQDVWAIPTAKFKKDVELMFCINSPMKEPVSQGLTIEFTGQAPFKLDIEINGLESGHPVKLSFDSIKTPEWTLNLSEKIASISGKHNIRLLAVADSRGCQNTLPVIPETIRKFKVLEVAKAVPAETRIDYCVNDMLAWDLSPTPPFKVRYDFEGIGQEVVVSQTRFERLATNPGVFALHSVSHDSQICEVTFLDEYKRVWPLPSASVSQSGDVVVDLREGDKTEIIFTFTGTPPFTFTYIKQLPQDKTDDQTILETQTISGITGHTYSIYAAEEGTWSVTALTDAHCSYPGRTIDDES